MGLQPGPGWIFADLVVRMERSEEGFISPNYEKESAPLGFTTCCNRSVEDNDFPEEKGVMLSITDF